MSYLNQALDPRRRTAAISGVVAIHALLALGLVSGLDVDIERIIDTPLGATNIPLDPPPPPPPPERLPEPDQSFVFAPPTPLPPLVADPVDIEVRDTIIEQRPLVVDPGPIVAPVIEQPRPLFAPKRVRPKNSPSRWITNDDYPPRALLDEAEGIAAYSLIVGTSGQVTACEVIRSTGNGPLDAATCRFIERRARFEAATDETGAKVVGTYTGTVRWDIPE